MLILNLKLSRFKQWFDVVSTELGDQNLIGKISLVLGMLSALRTAANRKTWRARMRKCIRCPIYNRTSKQCKLVFDGEVYGCGCYMPVKAMFADHGWLTETGQDTKGLCW